MNKHPEWSPRHLTDLAEYVNGVSFKPDDWGEEGLKIIRIEQLKDPSAPSEYYAGKLSPNQTINDGDLLFSWSASLFLKIWKDGTAALNQHLFKVIENDGIDRVFLKYFIEFHLPGLTSSSQGSTMQHITRKELAKYRANFPSDNEVQSKIAEVLTTVDQAIEQTEALIAKQQRIKTGLMQDLLTRGIDEHGNLRSEETHEFKDSPLGRIPVEWDVSSLESHLSYLSYGFTNPMPTAPDGPYMVTAANIHDNAVQYDNCRKTTKKAYDELLTKKSRPQPGDLLITKDGTLGRLAIADRTPICINQSVAVLRVKGNLDSVFLKLLMGSTSYQNRILADAGGSTIKHIYISKLGKMLVAIPLGAEEQTRIKVRLQTHEENLSNSRSMARKLQSIKAGLMQDLLTGEVPVTPLLELAETA